MSVSFRLKTKTLAQIAVQGDVSCTENLGPVTQASKTRTKTRKLKLHALDWLNKIGRNLCGAIQPKECILFVSLSLSFSL